MYSLKLSSGGMVSSAQLQHRLTNLALAGELSSRRMAHLFAIERLEARGQEYANQDFDVLSSAMNFLDAVDQGHNLRKGSELVARMRRGERVIVCDEWLDDIIGSDAANEVVSCHNRNRLGVHDQYVAWIGEENKPIDLEYVGQRAIGSK